MYTHFWNKEFAAKNMVSQKEAEFSSNFQPWIFKLLLLLVSGRAYSFHPHLYWSWWCMPVILPSGCIHLAEWQVSFGVSCITYLKNLSDPQWNVLRLQHVIWGISTYLHLQAMVIWVICCDPHCDLDNLYTLGNWTNGCRNDWPCKRDSFDKKAFPFGIYTHP